MACVVLEGSNDNWLLVVLELDPVSEPAGDSGDAEEEGEKLRRNSHGVVDQSSVKIDVGVDSTGDTKYQMMYKYWSAWAIL